MIRVVPSRALSPGFLGMKLNDLMEGPRSKVERANRHIDELIQASASLPDDLYEIAVIWGRSQVLLANPDKLDLTYKPKKSVKTYFGGIIGDTVNNLRESLNYFIRRALEAAGKSQKVDFPFAEERKDLETGKAYVRIKQAFPEAADFIGSQIEPCRDKNLLLWAASSLCNDNKHDDFLPNVSVAKVQFGTVRVGTHVIQSGSIGGDANHPIRLMSLSGNPITIEQNFRTSVTIEFPDTAIFAGQPVVTTLAKMSQVVSQTLDALEVFIKPYCK